MYTIKGVIEGTAPFLFNRPGDITKSGGQKKSEATLKKEAETKLYKDKDGLYWPAWNFKTMLLMGCNKAGLKVARAAMSSFLAGEVFPEIDPRFNRQTFDVMHSIPGKIPPKKGALVWLYRPCLNAGWKLSFDLSVLNDQRNADDIRKALEVAGYLVGMGAWRPEYGRFVIREWNIPKGETPKEKKKS